MRAVGVSAWRAAGKLSVSELKFARLLIRRRLTMKYCVQMTNGAGLHFVRAIELWLAIIHPLCDPLLGILGRWGAW